MSLVDEKYATEAISLANRSATMASHYMDVSKTLLEGLNAAEQQLACGQTSAARETLVETRDFVACKAIRIDAPDLVEMVARTIAHIREQNGAAPYDGLDAIHGKQVGRIVREQLFEEARAVLAALGLSITPASGGRHGKRRPKGEEAEGEEGQEEGQEEGSE